MTCLSIKNLTFNYDKDLVLDDVSLTIQEKEFVGIFGPNGGGKTTFLKLLMGFLKPSQGSITFTSKKIGYVPQAARFDKQFPISVLEIVLMAFLSEATWWGTYPAYAKQKALNALALVGLSGKEKQAFGTLSGGQAQRVLIARAIANDPEVLVLDEPTASVDKEAETAIYQLLESLRNSMTILLVTHDLQGIINRVDRLLCIHKKASFHKPQEVCSHFSLGLFHTLNSGE
jgi:zinc transport system ATP-binding protein